MAPGLSDDDFLPSELKTAPSTLRKQPSILPDGSLKMRVKVLKKKLKSGTIQACTTCEGGMTGNDTDDWTAVGEMEVAGKDSAGNVPVVEMVCLQRYDLHYLFVS